MKNFCSFLEYILIFVVLTDIFALNHYTEYIRNNLSTEIYFVSITY